MGFGGFGGSVQAMATIIKNNKLLTKKRKSRRERLQDVLDTDNYVTGSNEPIFTKEQIEAAKEKVRAQALKGRKKSRLILILTIIATPLVIWFTYWFIGILTAPFH